jgi:sugar phosphate isomerase/epimerase
MNPIVLAPTSLPNAAPLEYIDAAVRAGYDGIGLRLFRSAGIGYAFYPVTGDKQLEQQVKDALAGAGMKVYDILSFYMQAETDLESMKPALAFGAAIGAEYALVIGDDPDWGRMVDNFGRFSELTAGYYSLKPAIEAPVTQRVVNRLELAVNLIRESKADAVICIDPYHFNNVGDTPAMIRELSPALFPYSQIDDGTGTPPAGRCAPGEGKVPLADIFDALTPNLPLSLEWSAPRDSGYAAADWAKIALDTTRRYLEGYHARKG